MQKSFVGGKEPLRYERLLLLFLKEPLARGADTSGWNGQKEPPLNLGEVFSWGRTVRRKGRRQEPASHTQLCSSALPMPRSPVFPSDFFRETLSVFKYLSLMNSFPKYFLIA